MPTIGGIHYDTSWGDREKKLYLQDVLRVCNYIDTHVEDKEIADMAVTMICKHNPLVQRCIMDYNNKHGVITGKDVK